MKLVLAASLLLSTQATVPIWKVLPDIKLPIHVSDHSSTYVSASSSSDAAIYIAGGCNSPNGNTYVDANGLELDYFLCESYSDQLFAFDTKSFETKAQMPRPRYRHAAVSATGKLWLIGGRSIPEDSIIAEVDVYDPSTDTWSTVGTLPEAYLTSDNGAFANADGSTIYVVGGYNPQYFAPDALATTFSFQTAAALASSSASAPLAITRRADLKSQRGDIHAVSSGDGTKAYVAGGFSGMCQPLTSAEVYDLENDTWTSSGNLLKARGDGALVEASGTIFSIGGEVNHPDQCAAPELVPPLSHQALAINDVEALEYTSANDAAEWVDVATIPEFRFRFSAASWPPTGVAFAFGGQTSFDEACKCFPTTNEVTALYSETMLASDSGVSGSIHSNENTDFDSETTLDSDSGVSGTTSNKFLPAKAMTMATALAVVWSLL
mmetsp:Transcript_98/g.210  ORF Transcript_98/g.210 Transcript_98/m.210 type:complete len:437 (-) Transcript_98:242-1552(-)